jgi:hypothetical protein
MERGDPPTSLPVWGGSTKKCCPSILNDLRGPIYYIAEPPAMVSEMRKMLV